jgi:hypothetical protein
MLRLQLEIVKNKLRKRRPHNLESSGTTATTKREGVKSSYTADDGPVWLKHAVEFT